MKQKSLWVKWVWATLLLLGSSSAFSQAAYPNSKHFFCKHFLTESKKPSGITRSLTLPQRQRNETCFQVKSTDPIPLE